MRCQPRARRLLTGLSLADSLAKIDGVQDAVAAPSSDGSPTAKRLTLRIYLGKPVTADFSAITTDSLKLA